MLAVDNIQKRFGGLHAIADASLVVRQGEIVSLIGPNGAGKTTLFAIISGFLKADAGTIRFRDQDLSTLHSHQICLLGIVRTFQIVQPFAHLSVRENIAVGAHNRIANRREALQLADQIGSQLHMQHLLQQPANALTVAGRKRLEIARALATQPSLLLLDEVMAGLNATEIGEIVNDIRRIRDDGITILLTEHVMQAVMQLSDRTYVLNNGGIIAEGAPQEICRDDAVIEAYLGKGARKLLQTEGAGHA